MAGRAAPVLSNPPQQGRTKRRPHCGPIIGAVDEPEYTGAPPLHEPPLCRLAEQRPIFAERGRSFTAPAAARVVERSPAGVRLAVDLQDGGAAELLVEATASGALRLRWKARSDAPEPVSEADGMLGEGARPGAAAVTATGDCVAVDTGAWTWRMSLPSLGWELHRGDRLVVRQQVDDWNFMSAASRPLGTTHGPSSLRTWSYESFQLQPGERLYGLGQQYGALQKRGLRTVLWNTDALGVNATTLSYHNVPFLWSSAGWGAVVHTGGRVACELGNPSHGTATLAADGEVLDLFLLCGDTPAELLRAFYELTGAPPAIEPWGLGVWMSRCMYQSRDQVTTIAERLAEIGMPVDVLHLDPAWMQRHRPFKQEYGSDFVWNEEGFGDAAGFFAEMRRHELRVSLWENPYPLRHSAMERALESVGGLAARVDADGAAEPTESRGSAVIADFTNPRVVEWWTEQHHALMALGAAAFKTDFGEGVPEDALFGDGRTGAQIHNLYAHLYNRATFEAERSAGMANPLVFGRSGWLGSHRYPLQWSGDARSTWEDLRGALRAALSAALTGTAYWASDIGGFYVLPGMTPDPELFARWTWMGCLSGISRFHGTFPHEPYELPADACAAVVQAARLRYALLPYLVRCMPQGRTTDLPLMRPLVLAYPDDERVADDATEYMLGDDLLVAPILEPGGARRVHLPEGAWGDWWTGEIVEGPVTLPVRLGIDRVPLYQRAGSAVPVGRGLRVERVLAGRITEKAADEAWQPEER